MVKVFYIARTGVKRVVYTAKSGAKYIKSKGAKRYLSNKQIKDSHKRASKKKTTPKKKTKRKSAKKTKSRFSLWGGA